MVGAAWWFGVLVPVVGLSRVPWYGIIPLFSELILLVDLCVDVVVYVWYYPVVFRAHRRFLSAPCCVVCTKCILKPPGYTSNGARRFIQKVDKSQQQCSLSGQFSRARPPNTAARTASKYSRKSTSFYFEFYSSFRLRVKQDPLLRVICVFVVL